MVLLGDGRVEAGQFVRVYAYVGGRVGVGVCACEVASLVTSLM